jgi:hypothetical protein
MPMVAYRFEIDDQDGTAGHAESGPIALGREGHDGWVAGARSSEIVSPEAGAGGPRARPS